mgnify:FL=1
MALITKINGLAYDNISKYNNLAKASTKKVGGTRNYLDNNAVSKALDNSGSGHEIFIADSNGDFRFDHDDAMSVSFWIKPGWNTSLNTSTYLFSWHNVGGANGYQDGFLMYFYEPHNRLYGMWTSNAGGSKQYRRNFWHFHNNYGTYATAYAAAGATSGSWTWNSAARGNVGNDDYTLITITRGTAATSLYANFKLYWNAADCGQGYYKTGVGGGSGTVSQGNSTDKLVSLGDYGWGFKLAGNNNETKYNGLTIWDKELSSSEVTELYNSGAPMHVGTHSAYANCVGWYNFEDDGVGEISGNESFAINGDSNLEAK